MAGNAPTILEDLSGLAGQEVSVPCSVDVATCGDFHSVKWYRESQRVFVYSELANLERSEGSLTNRYFHSPFSFLRWHWARACTLYTSDALISMHIRSVKVPRNVAGSTVAQWYCRTVKKHYMNDLISRIPRRWYCQRVLHVSHNIGPVYNGRGLWQWKVSGNDRI